MQDGAQALLCMARCTARYALYQEIRRLAVVGRLPWEHCGTHVGTLKCTTLAVRPQWWWNGFCDA